MTLAAKCAAHRIERLRHSATYARRWRGHIGGEYVTQGSSRAACDGHRLLFKAARAAAERPAHAMRVPHRIATGMRASVQMGLGGRGGRYWTLRFRDLRRRQRMAAADQLTGCFARASRPLGVTAKRPRLTAAEAAINVPRQNREHFGPCAESAQLPRLHLPAVRKVTGDLDGVLSAGRDERPSGAAAQVKVPRAPARFPQGPPAVRCDASAARRATDERLPRPAPCSA